MDFIWLLIKTVFWLVIFACLITALLTHFLFWFEQRLISFSENESTPLSGLSLIKNTAIEFFCLVMSCFMIPFGKWVLSKKKLSAEDNSPAGIPILFVHGYLDHRNVWLWFVYQLQKRGINHAFFFINLLPPLASIQTLAETLKDKIIDIQEKTGSKQIILVGHSMGGLVCSYYAGFLAKPDEVARIITIGTPYHGTRLAALALGQNAQHMSPNSSFLAELRERVQQSKVPHHVILSKMDNIVVPWQSALLLDETDENTLILEDYSHLEFLISTTVINQIIKWL